MSVAQRNKSRSMWVRKESYPPLFHARAWVTGLGVAGLIAAGALVLAPLFIESQVEQAAKVRLASLGFEVQSADAKGQDLELWIKAGPGTENQVLESAQALAQTTKCDLFGAKLPCVEQAKVHLASDFTAQAPSGNSGSQGDAPMAAPNKPEDKAPVQAPSPTKNAVQAQDETRVKSPVDEAARRCQAELSSLMAQESIRFKIASTRILNESYKQVQKLAEVAADCPGYILVIGHTDNVGKAQSNAWLSRVRARAVRRALISRGLPQEKVIAQGKGASEPIASNDSADGRAKNRRIEFRVVLNAPSSQESSGQ